MAFRSFFNPSFLKGADEIFINILMAHAPLLTKKHDLPFIVDFIENALALTFDCASTYERKKNLLKTGYQAYFAFLTQIVARGEDTLADFTSMLNSDDRMKFLETSRNGSFTSGVLIPYLFQILLSMDNQGRDTNDERYAYVLAFINRCGAGKNHLLSIESKDYQTVAGLLPSFKNIQPLENCILSYIKHNTFSTETLRLLDALIMQGNESLLKKISQTYHWCGRPYRALLVEGYRLIKSPQLLPQANELQTFWSGSDLTLSIPGQKSWKFQLSDFVEDPDKWWNRAFRDDLGIPDFGVIFTKVYTANKHHPQIDSIVNRVLSAFLEVKAPSNFDMLRIYLLCREHAKQCRDFAVKKNIIRALKLLYIKLRYDHLVHLSEFYFELTENESAENRLELLMLICEEIIAPYIQEFKNISKIYFYQCEFWKSIFTLHQLAEGMICRGDELVYLKSFIARIDASTMDESCVCAFDKIKISIEIMERLSIGDDISKLIDDLLKDDKRAHKHDDYTYTIKNNIYKRLANIVMRRHPFNDSEQLSIPLPFILKYYFSTTDLSTLTTFINTHEQQSSLENLMAKYWFLLIRLHLKLGDDLFSLLEQLLASSLECLRDYLECMHEFYKPELKHDHLETHLTRIATVFQTHKLVDKGSRLLELALKSLEGINVNINDFSYHIRSFQPFSILLPELQQEIASHLDLRSYSRLARTSRSMHAMFGSIFSPVSYLGNLVVSGRQGPAQSRIAHNPTLLTQKIKVLIDCSGRHFPNITILQYAFWALDIHMVRMILQYLPKKEAARQLNEHFSNPAYVKIHGQFFNPASAIASYQNFITKQAAAPENVDHLQKLFLAIGLEQRYFPVHIIHELCYVDRSFTARLPSLFDENRLTRIAKVIFEGKTIELYPLKRRADLGYHFVLLHTSSKLSAFKHWQEILTSATNPVKTNLISLEKLFNKRLAGMQQITKELFQSFPDFKPL